MSTTTPARVRTEGSLARLLTGADAGGPTAWLRLVPSVPTSAPRAPFVALVIAILGAGLVGLLLLNTSLQKGAFELSALRHSTAALADRQSELEQRAGVLASPESVTRAAGELGMVPASDSVYLRLADGKVIGKRVPARRPVVAEPVVKSVVKPVVRPAAKLAAGGAPTTTAKPGSTNGTQQTRGGTTTATPERAAATTADTAARSRR